MCVCVIHLAVYRHDTVFSIVGMINVFLWSNNRENHP